MKRCLLVLVELCFSLVMLAQVTTTVELKESGTLLNLLTDSQIANTQKIVIFGEALDSKDFSVLKTMCIKNKLQEIDIENTNTSIITERAFETCENLKKIKLPKYLINTGWYSFYDCTNLKDIELPSSVTTIANSFRGCSSLESIIFGRNVKEINGQSFLYCYNLKEVHCKGTTPPKCEFGSFETSYSSCILYVPTGFKKDYAYANGWLYFENIKEEKVEAPYYVNVNVYGKALVLRIYPFYDFKGGNVAQFIFPENKEVIEIDKDEDIYFQIDTHYYAYYVECCIDKILLNGEDITANLVNDIISFKVEKDSQLDIYIKEKNATAAEDIKNDDIFIVSTSDGIMVNYPRDKGTVFIYDLNGRVVCEKKIHTGINYISMTPGIYIIVLDEKKVKLKI